MAHLRQNNGIVFLKSFDRKFHIMWAKVQNYVDLYSYHFVYKRKQKSGKNVHFLFWVMATLLASWVYQCAGKHAS